MLTVRFQPGSSHTAVRHDASRPLRPALVSQFEQASSIQTEYAYALMGAQCDQIQCWYTLVLKI